MCVSFVSPVSDEKLPLPFFCHGEEHAAGCNVLVGTSAKKKSDAQSF